MSERRVVLRPRPPCPSGPTVLDLRRFAAGELDEEQRARISSHLENCLDCASVVAEIETEKAAFHTLVPFERFAGDLEARLARRRAMGRLASLRIEPRALLAAGALAAAAAAVALWIGVRDEAQVRSKGGSEQLVGFYVLDQSGVRRGQEGERLRRGDRVQLLVRPVPGARSMVVLGVDGRGAISVYTAHRLGGDIKGESGLRPLPESLVLDDAVGPERFFVVFSTDGDAEKLAREARRAARELVQRGADLRRVRRLPLSDPRTVQGSVGIVKVEP